ncbi:MAG: 4Fe-4S dicluster domain-containing protein [Nitrospiraceae bacterium]|nr:4Fe-4S dicluster domain-containing protein [Nitrospiraceae bacterium]
MVSNTMPVDTKAVKKGVLIDLTKCIGCRGCQVICKNWNNRAVKKTVLTGNFTNPLEMNSETYTTVKFFEEEKENKMSWNFVKTQCMHCKDPACASACPVGAFTKDPRGPVTYNAEKCIGCRYCMMACPFGVPKYEWEKLFPVIQKCTFCVDRLDAGLIPSCAKTCTSKAIFFGDYDAIVAEAEKRIKDNPEKYVNHIYGKEEAGGTSWMYLSSVPFEQLGFKTNIPKRALPDLTWASLSKVPAAVGTLITVLSLVAYFRNRGDKDKGE